MKTNERQLNLRAGVFAAVRWGIFGAISAAFVVAVLGWNDLMMFQEDLAWFLRFTATAFLPIIGCATIFGCAGWAAYATRPPSSIAVSLLLIFSISLAAWLLIAAAEVTPRRYKGLDHPILYPSEFLALVTPPVVVAAVFVVVRCANTSTSP